MSCDDIIDGKHMLSKTICVCGDGSGGVGGDGGWRRAVAACGGGVRQRRVAARAAAACGGVRRHAADKGNQFATMEQEGVRRQLMF
jgi:hypothetical protein